MGTNKQTPIDLNNRPYPRYGGGHGGKRGGYGSSSNSYSRDGKGPKHGSDKWRNKSFKSLKKYRELLAAFFMLMTFCANEKGTHIRLKLDNTTAVACIIRKASNKVSLMELTNIWLWALERNIIFSAEYLPRLKNATADAKSRAIVNNDIKWTLKKHIFEAICDTFSKPDIDLFATR